MLFLLIGVAITLWASYNIKATFQKYSQLRYSKNATAEVVANWILKQNGITNVRIERISGSLTDHYDPANKVLRLSDSVYGSASMAAIGVAAHECGHAMEILSWSGDKELLVGGSAQKERMNEVNTHLRWAKRTAALASIYGVQE